MSERTVEADISTYLSEPTGHEQILTGLFKRSESLTIFDVGACEGEDSIRYAKLFPEARIYSFEPLAENQRLARANFEKYQVQTAELVGAALSDRGGTAAFHVSAGEPPVPFRGKDWNYGNKSSSLLSPKTAEPMFGWLRFETVVEVPCETIDAFCAQRHIRRIDFVHLDVQGAESLVLAGARRMMTKITAIWLEVSDEELYAGQRLRPDIERWMRRRGFVRCLEMRRDAEGDQFWMNLRDPRAWRVWIAARLSAIGHKLRRVLGGSKSRASPSPSRD